MNQRVEKKTEHPGVSVVEFWLKNQSLPRDSNGDPMPIQETTRCYLCGRIRPFQEMSVMGSPALGAQVDFALSVSWLCPDPCFEKARHSPTIRARIYAEHDRIERANRADLEKALQTDESTILHLGTLPDGLRVSEPDMDRVAGLKGDYSAQNLQDPETIHACFRLLRNERRLPFFHPEERSLWDYDHLRERLQALEVE